jgi:hypothetical protein
MGAIQVLPRYDGVPLAVDFLTVTVYTVTIFSAAVAR